MSIKSGEELRRWYWRKDELAKHALSLGLKSSSGKFVILERVAHYLDTGEKNLLSDKAPKPTSKFDWHSENLSKTTIITDSYKKSTNIL